MSPGIAMLMYMVLIIPMLLGIVLSFIWSGFMIGWKWSEYKINLQWREP